MSDDERDIPLGQSAPAGWLWAGVWLVYLLVPLVDNFSRKYQPWRQAAGMIGFWLFCYAYTKIVVRSRRGRSRPHAPQSMDRKSTSLLLAVVGLAIVLPIVASPAWIALWIYVASACGAVLPYEPRRWAPVGGVLATAALAAEAALRGVDAGTWGWMVLPSVFACFAVVGVRRMRNLIVELHWAREEVKHLATNEERLRMARDLHDLAGHSMATITLKAELARRLIPADPAAAQKQVADIEQVSRQALADIREAVSGYRRATLAVETVSARTALEAAQISFEHDPVLARRPSGLDPQAESVLAWCLREAVTNVVRHSGATWCRARLIEARVNGERTVTLEVTDNGTAVPKRGRADGRGGEYRGGEGGEGGVGVSRGQGLGVGTDASRGVAEHSGRPRLDEASWGNGLTGLHERLAPFAASLAAGPVAPHGFRLAATLPVDESR
ncbi:MAG TPA: histidine kinase [Actinocrinis sp.]|uniref:sensor histidine kinase n=1 Tax=Actinocrinis sp. TaxID=1920516 RepID=UPI002DDD8E57|nr:histidine kinase [Actinocrinis sp.]HEV2347789.1 histidine kinase [Actinocrinis sp.]